LNHFSGDDARFSSSGTHFPRSIKNLGKREESECRTLENPESELHESKYPRVGLRFGKVLNSYFTFYSDREPETGNPQPGMPNGER
ncbi:MAG: hypothetical protein V5A14_04705, partial [Desulfohalobiaceae bacterium]